MHVQTDRHYGKTLVLNMQTNKFGIIGTDDIEEEGYIATYFRCESRKVMKSLNILIKSFNNYYFKSCEKIPYLRFLHSSFIYYIVTHLGA